MNIRYRYSNQFGAKDAEGIMSNASTPESRGRSRLMLSFAVGLLVTICGLGTGWIGGKALTEAVISQPGQNGTLSAEDPGLSPPLHTESQPSVENSNSLRAPATREKRTPNSGERDDEITEYEKSTQEVGRKALREMMKEIKRMNRGERQRKPDGEDDSN